MTTWNSTLRKSTCVKANGGYCLRLRACLLQPMCVRACPVTRKRHPVLQVEEREVIEACYRQGVVRVLTATSTLAAGVNLPARRVIFRQPRIGRELLDATRYRQMAGRAGRAGIDCKGESVSEGGAGAQVLLTQGDAKEWERRECGKRAEDRASEA